MFSLAVLAASAFAQDDVLSTPAVRAQMSKLYRTALLSYVGFSDLEHSFTVKADGVPNGIHSTNDFRHDFLEMVVGEDIAIVHTHPARTRPDPSSDDVKVAVRLGVPNYVMSQFVLWVALPDGTTRKVAELQWKHGDVVLRRP
jgi:hypothetical protein